MTDPARRTALRAQYEQTRAPPASTASSTASPAGRCSAPRRIRPASRTCSPSPARRRCSAPSSLAIKADVAACGLDAFALEVLETVTPEPDADPAALRREPATLGELWREKLDPGNLS